MADTPTVMTVGHSTHPIDAFIALLRRHGIELVADVRRFPGSRRLPQFNAEALEQSLAAEGIRYVHLPELGGRRRPVAGSGNQGWRKDGFRGYADHMQSDEFAAGLERLIAAARERRTAMMCAEGLWWRCHRRLVADALVARGGQVLHIGPDGAVTAHELTPFAAVEGTALSYPAVS